MRHDPFGMRQRQLLDRERDDTAERAQSVTIGFEIRIAEQRRRFPGLEAERDVDQGAGITSVYRPPDQGLVRCEHDRVDANSERESQNGD